MTPKEQKCKIKDAAKDLNLTANDIIEIVKTHTGAEKKPAASLTESEMNIVLEHISQKNQVKSFDAYFAAGEKKKEEKPVKQEEKPAEVKAEKPEKAMKLAIEGMLPNNTIGRKAATRMRLYRGAEHVNAAQKPEEYKF